MAEASASETDYQPGFQAAGQEAFVEANNFFYHNYDVEPSPTMSLCPAELSTLAPAQPIVPNYAYNCPNFFPLAPYPSQNYPFQFIPPQGPAPFSRLPPPPMQPQYPKNQQTRKRKPSKEKTTAPKKKKTTAKENKTIVKEEVMSPKRIKEEPAEEDGEKAAEKPKRKKKKKAVRREGLAEWDFQHRKECQFYPKGSLLVKCEDAESNTFGKEIWMVDNYQLINKYVMERDDPCLGRIFIKTDKYSGWMSDESWSYYLVNGTTLDKGRERIGVTLFPTEDTVRDFCVMEKLRNPFYEELMQRLREQEPEGTVKTEVADELEEGEIVSDTREQPERPTVEQEPPDEEEDFGDLQEIDKTQLFFYNN